MRREFAILLDELKVAEEEIKVWLSMRESLFPLSFVHGDLVTDNFMVSNAGIVVGILDFEFVGVDWRIMDLATSLSKFPEDDNPLHNLTSSHVASAQPSTRSLAPS